MRENERRWAERRERERLARDPHALYRIYGADRDLLYVGISKSFPGRMKQHAAAKPWWRDVSDIHLEHFENEATASEAEIAAIRAERPRYNVTHTVPRVPKPKADLLTMSEAAQELWITCSELRTLINMDLVDYASEGSQRRIHRDEVERVRVDGLLWAADALPVDFALSWDDLVIDEGSGYLTEQ
jgi:hypothetical protein